MAMTFVAPGGDETLGNPSTSPYGPLLQHTDTAGNLAQNGTVQAATDFVHGAHQRSYGFGPGGNNQYQIPAFGSQNANGRVNMFMYFVTLPNAASSIISMSQNLSSASIRLRMTSAGVLQVFNNTVQIGTNGSTLSTGQWYRICVAFAVTSTTVNEIRVYVEGVLDISITNATLTTALSDNLQFGNNSSNGAYDVRISDIYVDDSSSLADPGNIWVTVKRPNANGTTNGFTTQIGSGGSGYGTGHSPQVNERPNTDTNGWSIVGAGSAVTEEYNIESKSTGDIDISAAIIVDTMVFAKAKALVQETGSLIVNGNTTSVTIRTNDNVPLRAFVGGSTYPAGTGADVGIVTDTSLTTVSLYEIGAAVAYIPNTASSVNVTDSITISESITMNEFSFINKSDSITISESITIQEINFVSVTDSLAIGESITLQKFSFINVTESLSITESIILQEISFISATEALTITELISITSQLGSISISDAITISETVTMIEISFISVSDSLSLTESRTITNSQLGDISAIDTLTLSELITVANAQLGGISVNDSLTLSESRTVTLIIVAAALNGIAIMRSKENEWALAMDVLDSVDQ